MDTRSISVFLPAYNEEENIEHAVNSIYTYLKKHFPTFEVIVVDDGSKDKTAVLVQGLAKKHPEIKLVTHKKNLGYGAALRSGFKTAQYDLVFYTDADNQFNIEDMNRIMPFVDKYDVVSGYRMKRQDPLTRIFTANVYNVIVRLLFGLPTRDIDASFKIYKKHVIDNLNLKSNTGLIDAEMLIKARKKGFTIGQTGVPHYPRTKGKTTYEIGKRNDIIAFVRPQVVIDVLNEMKTLWKELH